VGLHRSAESRAVQGLKERHVFDESRHPRLEFEVGVSFSDIALVVIFNFRLLKRKGKEKGLTIFIVSFFCVFT